MAKRRAHREGSIFQIQSGTRRAIVPLGNGKRRYLRAQTRAELVRKDDGRQVSAGRWPTDVPRVGGCVP